MFQVNRSTLAIYVLKSQIKRGWPIFLDILASKIIQEGNMMNTWLKGEFNIKLL